MVLDAFELRLSCAAMIQKYFRRPVGPFWG